jgi:hypothetical protein
MPDLPERKVGIVACSGEELAEGTVTRLAALKVLERIRPGDTVTICLPLFLAGGQGDRVFARFHPTITLDGCEKLCAARGTEMYSAKPAASIVVRDVTRELGLAELGRARHLSPAGQQAVDAVADRVTQKVDELLGSKKARQPDRLAESEAPADNTEKVATCSCGSGIPIQRVDIDGQEITSIALPLIFAQFRDAGKAPGEATTGELMGVVGIYNAIPPEQTAAYTQAIASEYSTFWARPKPATH